MTGTPARSPFEANVEIVGVMAAAERAALTRALDRLDDEFDGPMSLPTQASFLLRSLRAEGYDIHGVGLDQVVAALAAAAAEVQERGAFFSGTAAVAEFLHARLTGRTT